MAKIEINLLPKELRRKRRGFTLDKSLTLIAAFVGILVILVGVASILQSVKLKALDEKIAEAQRKTDELRKSIDLVDALSEIKDKVLQRMSVIEVLDRNRAVWVRVMEDLSGRVPDYVWLSLLREEESKDQAAADTSADTTVSDVSVSRARPPVKRVTMEGHSHSLNSLASFLIQLMGSPYFKNIELQYVKRAEVREFKTFSFQLVGDLYYLPEFESPDADATVEELTLTDPSFEGEDSEMNLAAGRE
jgi:Tfp pilus assembly protein PilN